MIEAALAGVAVVACGWRARSLWGPIRRYTHVHEIALCCGNCGALMGVESRALKPLGADGRLIVSFPPRVVCPVCVG